MFYVEYKDSDTVEFQNGMNEEGLIDFARNIDSSKNIYSVQEAMDVIYATGKYDVFEDC